MKFYKLGIYSTSLLFAIPSFGIEFSSCYDCYTFVAPTIVGAESLSTPEVGLIVYDSSFGAFRGYNSANKWSKISSELKSRSVSSAGPINFNDDLIIASAGANYTLDLPAAGSVPGKVLTIKKSDTTAFQITVDPYSSETIDGLANLTLKTQNDFIEIISTGSNWVTRSQKIYKAPTVQKFTSSTGSYMLPSNPSPLYIRVRMVGGGGGGGGGGQGTGSTAGGPGGVSTFGGSLLVANGGTGGAAQLGAAGNGGTAVLGSGPAGSTFIGGGGQPGYGFNVSNGNSFGIFGGVGGSSIFGGGGRGGNSGVNAGTSGATNSGAGGGGGSSATANSVLCYSGAGGGAGGSVDAIINTPSSSYSYQVGAGGTPGSAGTNGGAGGSGALGYIEVTEYYQ